MTKKQYKELAGMLENKASQWLAVDITDFLEENFGSFDREKFMIACGFGRAYSHDELLTAYFSEIDDYVNQSVKIVTH
ncbi:MAG: hypothetical protein FVQ80_11215 [Planctomycetes bacterium]|nr:hypothetical protein [Planctomycetota bacterium]